MLTSPSLIASARRRLVSASGPRITAISTGASGSPKRRRVNPSSPISTSITRSTIDADDAYTPSAANTVMPAYRYGLGISSSFAQIGANGRLITSSTIMPMNRLASSAHTRSALRVNSSGPGCMPYCWKAASMIAAVAEVGRPSASSEPMADPAVALAADSGAARPRIAPLPNCGSCRRRSRLPLQPEGQEGRDLRAAGRDGAERHAERRAAQPRRQRLAELRAAQVGPAADPHRGGRRVLVDAGGDEQHLAQRQQPDGDHHDVDAVEQRRHAEGVPGGAADRVDADQRERQPDGQRGDALDGGVGDHRRGGDEGDHGQREVLGRAEHGGQVGQYRGEEHHHDRGQQAAGERADGGGGQRLRARGRVWPSDGPRRWRRWPWSCRGCSSGWRWSSRRTARRSRCRRT